MRTTPLADRMKSYEAQADQKLVRKVPVVVRVDGQAFHTYTKVHHKDKPMDYLMHTNMIDTAYRTMVSAPTCVGCYVQSDEISFVLTDTRTPEAEPWFNNEVNKLVSIFASRVTSLFLYNEISVLGNKFLPENIPTFDARAFNVPLDDLPNYLIWRVRDAQRNAISSTAHSLYTPKQLHGVRKQELLDKIAEKGVDFYNDYPQTFINGAFMLRSTGIESYDLTDVNYNVFDEWFRKELNIGY